MPPRCGSVDAARAGHLDHRSEPRSPTPPRPSGRSAPLRVSGLDSSSVAARRSRPLVEIALRRGGFDGAGLRLANTCSLVTWTTFASSGPLRSPRTPMRFPKQSSRGLLNAQGNVFINRCLPGASGVRPDVFAQQSVLGSSPCLLPRSMRFMMVRGGSARGRKPCGRPATTAGRSCRRLVDYARRAVQVAEGRSGPEMAWQQSRAGSSWPTSACLRAWASMAVGGRLRCRRGGGCEPPEFRFCRAGGVDPLRRASFRGRLRTHGADAPRFALTAAAAIQQKTTGPVRRKRVSSGSSGSAWPRLIARGSHSRRPSSSAPAASPSVVRYMNSLRQKHQIVGPLDSSRAGHKNKKERRGDKG